MLEYVESKNCFSKKECDSLLKKYKKTKWKMHQWYSPKEGFLKPKKNHKELLVTNIERKDGEFIISKLEPFVLKYLGAFLSPVAKIKSPPHAPKLLIAP